MEELSSIADIEHWAMTDATYRGRGLRVAGVAPVALVPAAAFAVHQLRYVLAFGSHAGVELQRQGHAYLHSVVPWIVLTCGLAAGGFLRALGRAWGGECSPARYAVSLTGLWLTCSVCLLTIYVGQELLEGLLATGHPAGLAGVFGYGGWWSIPAAACIGLVLAAIFHSARWVLRQVALRCGRPPDRGPAPNGSSVRACNVFVARLAPLADGWSGRGPPG